MNLISKNHRFILTLVYLRKNNDHYISLTKLYETLYYEIAISKEFGAIELICHYSSKCSAYLLFCRSSLGVLTVASLQGQEPSKIDRNINS